MRLLRGYFKGKVLSRRDYFVLRIFLWIYAFGWLVGIYAIYLSSSLLILKIAACAVGVVLTPDLPTLLQSYDSYRKMMEEKFPHKDQ